MTQPTIKSLQLEEKLQALREEYKKYPEKRSIIIRQARIYQAVKDKILAREPKQKKIDL